MGRKRTMLGRRKRPIERITPHLHPAYRQTLARAASNAPVDNHTFDEDFAEDLGAISEWLGSLGDRRAEVNQERPPPSHLELAAMLGGEAMILFKDSSYRNWTEPGMASEISWCRILWQRAQSFSTGYITARHRVLRGDRAGWCPTLEPLGRFLGVANYVIMPSRRPLDPLALEQGAFWRVFGAAMPQLSPMQAHALSDSFATHPNPDNPISGTLRRSLRKLVRRLETPVPYWWRLAIYDWLGEWVVGEVITTDGAQVAGVGHDRPAGDAGGAVEEPTPETGATGLKDAAETLPHAQNGSGGDVPDPGAVRTWLTQALTELIVDNAQMVNAQDGHVFGYQGRVCLKHPEIWTYLLNRQPRTWRIRDTDELEALAGQVGWAVASEGALQTARLYYGGDKGNPQPVTLASLTREAGEQIRKTVGLEDDLSVSAERTGRGLTESRTRV